MDSQTHEPPRPAADAGLAPNRSGGGPGRPGAGVPSGTGADAGAASDAASEAAALGAMAARADDASADEGGSAWVDEDDEQEVWVAPSVVEGADHTTALAAELAAETAAEGGEGQREAEPGRW